MSTISSITTVLSYVFFTIGLWNIFKKCGVEKKWALVPVARICKIAQCADIDEIELKWFISELITKILINLGEAGELFGFSEFFTNIVNIVTLPLLICTIVFRCKGYYALSKTFQVKRKKLWTLLCVTFPGIAVIIWGLCDKYQPIKKEEEEEKVEVAVTSEKEAEILKEGLTINLEERTVKKFLGQRKCLLRNIHMNIEPGRMILLLGGSGAGKTTFLNAVTGYEMAKAKMYLNGHDIYKEFETIKHDIGFVPQQDLIRYNDTVKNTVYDFAKLRLPTNVKKEELNKSVDEALNIFGLQPVQDNMVAKQSGGQKKRTSISMEFVTSPSLFILDEPDSGLDGVLALDLMKRLHDIAKTGKIVIVITHSPDRALEFFDDVIVLAKDKAKTGRLVFYGPVEQAKQFFGKDKMEDVIKMINRKEEGGEGLADELIERFESGRETK